MVIVELIHFLQELKFQQDREFIYGQQFVQIEEFWKLIQFQVIIYKYMLAPVLDECLIVVVLRYVLIQLHFSKHWNYLHGDRQFDHNHMMDVSCVFVQKYFQFYFILLLIKRIQNKYYNLLLQYFNLLLLLYILRQHLLC